MPRLEVIRTPIVAVASVYQQQIHRSSPSTLVVAHPSTGMRFEWQLAG
jgi:hypothetical protein